MIKCIDLNEGEALRRGRVERGWRGRGGWKGGKFYLGVELIKCIDPSEGEALRRGPPSNLGVWRPLPLCSTACGGGGREGGRI